jgi:succinate-semialdehyde dehydrogenase/glutarate-semialdehyde dehydrogenase
MQLRSINPATGQLVKEFYELHTDQLEAKIASADKAFHSWRKVPVTQRVQYLAALSRLLRTQKSNLSRLITLEMGKPILQSLAEIEKCATLCDYYIEHAPQFLASQSITTQASLSFISMQPLGVLLGIMPWNFPFWQVFRFAIPAIMGGNTVVMKHASNVSGCSMAIERLFTEAAFPEGVFASLLISHLKVERIIADRRVRGVSLTGSTQVGKEVARMAGEHLKKSVVELGGSDAYIILKDADISKAVDCCVTARLINTGQSCIAANRFVVVEDVYDQFQTLFVEKMKGASMGNPFVEFMTIGPMARQNLRDDLHIHVSRSVDMGATLLCGGQIPEGDGYFYPATVLADVKEGMPAWDNELFGPVASLIRAKDMNDAIFIANNTSFGLGAAVFTSNIELGRQIAEQELEAGCCFVNDFVKSDPRLPFGGIKESGYGRELSHFGMAEFMNIKTIWVK